MSQFLQDSDPRAYEKLVDRLLADKQALSEKCDLLTQELKRMEKMFNDAHVANPDFSSFDFSSSFKRF